jgi:hypothetical protein
MADIEGRVESWRKAQGAQGQVKKKKPNKTKPSKRERERDSLSITLGLLYLGSWRGYVSSSPWVLYIDIFVQKL